MSGAATLRPSGVLGILLDTGARGSSETPALPGSPRGELGTVKRSQALRAVVRIASETPALTRWERGELGTAKRFQALRAVVRIASETPALTKC